MLVCRYLTGLLSFLHTGPLHDGKNKAGLLSLLRKAQKAQLFWHDLLTFPLSNTILLEVRISTQELLGGSTIQSVTDCLLSRNFDAAIKMKFVGSFYCL